MLIVDGAPLPVVFTAEVRGIARAIAFATFLKVIRVVTIAADTTFYWLRIWRLGA